MRDSRGSLLKPKLPEFGDIAWHYAVHRFAGIREREKRCIAPCVNLMNSNPARWDFVATNLQAAQSIAGTLQTTPANMLGLASLESGDGTSYLATEKNNYFGLTYPFPGATDSYDSPNGYSYSVYSNAGILAGCGKIVWSKQF